MPATSTNLATEALAYASRGWLIFPLWHIVDGICQCADAHACGSPGKHPRTRHGLSEASSDHRTVERWWSMWPDANIGMPMGANGLAAIDVDPRHDGEASLGTIWHYARDRGVNLFETRLIRTGSGGTHLIYRQPPGGIKSGARTFSLDGIDTRGRGGYIVAPPSLHASGQRYQVVENGCTIAPWPDVLNALLEPDPKPAPPAARPFRVLVTGSRTWTHPAPIKAALAALKNTHGGRLVVVHGACPRGADNIADRWCHNENVTAERHPADWSTGRAAGHKRNAAMVDTQPDICLAFIENESPGATGCAALAEKAGIPTFRNPDRDTIAAITAITPAETGLPPVVIACGPRPPKDGDRAAVWAFQALLSETKQLEELPLTEGHGKNQALNIAAYKLGRRIGAGYLDEASVTQALYAVASRWPGHTDRSIRATIESGIRDGIAKPHPGPTTRGVAR